jgi:glycosyltransferase involved in cell wall biosynthesis
MTVVSHHVRDILINNGVNIPIKVVGNGVDHYERLKSKKIEIPESGYTFLHISSCFYRKGIDVLIRAYFEEFQNNEDVLLVIKTSRNPHNNVEELLKAYAQGKSTIPKWHLIYDDLDPAQINYLYEYGDCLVAPSRAEGFGLPFAEAKLRGQSLITTKWGGALDFCSPDNTYFVDYQFAGSKSHLQLFDSIWAEPDLENLKSAMRSVYNSGRKKFKLGNLELARKSLSEFTWKKVAARIYKFSRDQQLLKNKRQPKIGFVSTIFKRCGIATYSQHLINYMGGPCHVYADYDSQEIEQWPIYSKLCWQEGSDKLERLTALILNDQIDVIVIQFNYGFFEFSSLRKFLLNLIAHKKTVIVELHSTIDPKDQPDKLLILLKDALLACDRVIVHDVSDMNRLKSFDIVRNVVLVPHGLQDYPNKRSNVKVRKNIKIASYGFFLPDKGLLELIEAFNIAASEDENIELFMYNAEYPSAVSKNIIEIAKEKIKKCENRNRIHLDIGFYSDDKSFKQLSDVDILVYPYQQSNESASGAVRYGIAAGVIVLVTPLSVFSNVEPAVAQLSGFDPQSISLDILKYSRLIREKSIEIIEMKKKQKAKDAEEEEGLEEEGGGDYKNEGSGKKKTKRSKTSSGESYSAPPAAALPYGVLKSNIEQIISPEAPVERVDPGFRPWWGRCLGRRLRLLRQLGGLRRCRSLAACGGMPGGHQDAGPQALNDPAG